MAMRSVDDVFSDFVGRRRGIIKALTTEADQFFAQCDPSKENLCLYGYADGSWEVTLPSEEVPAELPEPALGINFARDGMKRSDWLCLVAVHSDCWLMGMTYYNAAKIDQKGRGRLLEEVNQLPTCFEIVSGRAGKAPGSGGEGADGKRVPGRKADADDDDEDEEEDGSQGGEGDPCPNCGANYKAGEFWIQCDLCDRWYDGRCVGMTAKMADQQPQWKCPLC